MPDSGNMPLPETLASADLQLGLPISQKVVLVIDLVESVRLMAADEAGTVARWHDFAQSAQSRDIPAHHGRLVKSLGDGLMVEFEQARDATSAAQALHKAVAQGNVGLAAERQFHLRAGINATHVFTDNNDIYGAGVNLAARLATLAGPGETVVSASVRDGLTDGLDATVEDLGECYLKHIDQPVRAYRVGAAGAAPVVVAQRQYASPLQPTIAVIPFTSRSNEPEHFAIGELIADGVIGQLSRTRELKVISRLSTTAFRGLGVAVADIETHLGANYILSGSYWTSGKQILLSAELADARNNQIAWTERLSGDVGDLLQRQSELCNGIANGAHRAILDQEVQAALDTPIPSLASYSLYLAGVSSVHRALRANFDFGQKALQAVSDRHPRRGDVHAWLAKWYAIRANRGQSGNAVEDLTVAASLVRRAISEEPENAFVQTVSGLVKSFFLHDLEGADACYTKALALNPNEPLAWLYTGTLRAWQGRGQEAQFAADRALDLTPMSSMRYYVESLASLAMLSAGQLDRAIDLSKSAIRSNLTHTSSHRVLAMAQVMNGQVAEARETVAQLMGLEPGFSAQVFLQRYPGRDHGHSRAFADALVQAGVPEK
jgi:adenylate cyclase